LDVYYRLLKSKDISFQGGRWWC